MNFSSPGSISAGLILLVALLHSTALAVPGSGAVNLTFNTSSRAEGMAGAGVGLVWDENTNHWANPALLAFRPGIQYLDYHSNIAEWESDDITLDSEELTLGAYGITLLWSRGPLDGVVLEMDELTITDESGQIKGTFKPYWKSENVGLGVDFVQLAEVILGKEPGRWTRNWTLAGGYVWKDFEDFLGYYVDIVDPDAGMGTGQASDWGLALRATPWRFSEQNGLGNGGTMSLDLGFSLGYSVLNSTDEYIQHPFADQDDPFPTMHVYGGSIRLAAPLLEAKRQEWNARGWGILGDAVDPLFSFTAVYQNIQPGFVWDQAQQDYVYEWDTSGSYDETGYGFEIGLANLLYFRWGHQRAKYADVDGSSWGFGVNVQAGNYGGIRYDWASRPEAEGLPDVESRTWNFWVDPVAIFVK